MNSHIDVIQVRKYVGTLISVPYIDIRCFPFSGLEITFLRTYVLEIHLLEATS